MNKNILAAILFIGASQAVTSMAGVNVNVNLGVPLPPPVVVTQPPVYAPPPPPVYGQAPEVVYESQPQFIFSPVLGFYVSVGVPYDIVYIGSSYYLYNSGYWYVGPSYSGPWSLARKRMLPLGLRKYSYDKIRYYRDSEYRIYQRDPRHYRGRFYQPEWRRVEPRRAEPQHKEIRREEPRRDEHRGRGEDERR